MRAIVDKESQRHSNLDFKLWVTELSETYAGIEIAGIGKKIVYARLTRVSRTSTK